MTNTEIIFNNRLFLMEQGVIKGVPGTSVTVKDEDGERTVEMPEEIRTYDEWKRLGFIVQKGEHAVAKFQIWMPKTKKGKKVEAGESENADDAEMMAKGFYKKLSYFFTRDQVQAK